MTVQRPRLFAISLITALLIAGASARGENWIAVGPSGGDVHALASDPRDPQRIYLGTAEGMLYRSEDGGVRWHRLNPGFPRRGSNLDEIAVDRHGVVFVGYWDLDGGGGGVAQSTDGGQTFTLLKGVKGESVRALAVAASDPRVIAAGTLTGVLLSRDGGQNWRRITPRGHPDLRNVTSLAFDPTDPRIIYAGTWHLGWKTSDGGARWVPVHHGMIDDSHVMTLTVDRWNPDAIFATACSGIYRATEGATPWTKLRGIPFSSRRTRAFAQSGDDANVLLAGTTEGLWMSEDAGESWRRMTSKDLVVNALLVQPDGTILLGAEGAGVLRSSDRGRTWSASNTGFLEQFVSNLVFDTQGHRLFVAVRGDPHHAGVFVSSGGPEGWTRLGNGLDERQVLSLGLLGDTIVAGTDDGIFVRAPKEAAWSRLPTRVDGTEVHPRVNELLALSPRRLLAATSEGVILSADRAETWAPAALGNPGKVWDLAVSPQDPNCVLAATWLGVFRSRNGGGTWTRASSGLGDVIPHALAFMPFDDRILFVTTSGGLFRTEDQGSTWRRVTGGIPHCALTAIAIHPDGRTIYASDFTWGGIFRSADAGLTWVRMPTAGLASDRVWTLGLDPGSPERLLAATAAGGLHVLATESGAPNSAASE